MAYKWFAAAFRAALVAGVPAAAAPAAAADLSVALVEDAAPVVRVTGRLEPGDDLAFISIAKRLGSATVVLEGPAQGRDSALTGMNFGSIILAQGYATRLEAGRYCMAGCMLAWLGGETRAIHPEARIAFTTGLDASTHTGETTRRLVDGYLARLGRSDLPDLADGPPAPFAWMTGAEVAAAGFGRLDPVPAEPAAEPAPVASAPETAPDPEAAREIAEALTKEDAPTAETVAASAEAEVEPEAEIQAGTAALVDEAPPTGVADTSQEIPLSLPDGQFWIVLESARAPDALDPTDYEIAPRRFGLTTVRTRNGYYANAIGPFPETEALELRAGLQAEGAIPPDAYLSQGLGFVERVN